MPHDILFQLEFFFLLASAQIAAALTGFIGVVFVLGERAKGRLDVKESSAVSHFLFAGMGTLFVALLSAILLVCLSAHEALVWRLAAGVNALFHLTGAVKLALEVRRAEAGLSRGALVSSVGLVIGAACLTAALGAVAQFRILIVLLATLWSLGVTVLSFTSLLASHRAEKYQSFSAADR